MTRRNNGQVNTNTTSEMKSSVKMASSSSKPESTAACKSTPATEPPPIPTTPVDCPLCLEPLDADELGFFPCPCYYQVCRFCWHRLKEEQLEEQPCPACRRPYADQPYEWRRVTQSSSAQSSNNNSSTSELANKKANNVREAHEHNNQHHHSKGGSASNGLQSANGSIGGQSENLAHDVSGSQSGQNQIAGRAGARTGRGGGRTGNGATNGGQSSTASNNATADSRKHLVGMRVVQRNLVFVMLVTQPNTQQPNALAQAVAQSASNSNDREAEKILKKELIKFGKIIKLCTGREPAPSGTPAAQQAGPSSAYVTYTTSNEALAAIKSLKACGVKASLGTTKYCNHWLRKASCPKRASGECMYLHSEGDSEASFTKQQMKDGKHFDYEKRLFREILLQQQHTVTSQANGSVADNGDQVDGFVEFDGNDTVSDNLKVDKSDSLKLNSAQIVAKANNLPSNSTGAQVHTKPISMAQVARNGANLSSNQNFETADYEDQCTSSKQHQLSKVTDMDKSDMQTGIEPSQSYGQALPTSSVASLTTATNQIASKPVHSGELISKQKSDNLVFNSLDELSAENLFSNSFSNVGNNFASAASPLFDGHGSGADDAASDVSLDFDPIRESCRGLEEMLAAPSPSSYMMNYGNSTHQAPMAQQHHVLGGGSSLFGSGLTNQHQFLHQQQQQQHHHQQHQQQQHQQQLFQQQQLLSGLGGMGHGMNSSLNGGWPNLSSPGALHQQHQHPFASTLTNSSSSELASLQAAYMQQQQHRMAAHLSQQQQLPSYMNGQNNGSPFGSSQQRSPLDEFNALKAMLPSVNVIYRGNQSNQPPIPTTQQLFHHQQQLLQQQQRAFLTGAGSGLGSGLGLGAAPGVGPVQAPPGFGGPGAVGGQRTHVQQRQQL